jgi:hypothetical protein
MGERPAEIEALAEEIFGQTSGLGRNAAEIGAPAGIDPGWLLQF